jgi:hypothetical protein
MRRLGGTCEREGVEFRALQADRRNYGSTWFECEFDKRAMKILFSRGYVKRERYYGSADAIHGLYDPHGMWYTAESTFMYLPMGIKKMAAAIARTLPHRIVAASYEEVTDRQRAVWPARIMRQPLIQAGAISGKLCFYLPQEADPPHRSVMLKHFDTSMRLTNAEYIMLYVFSTPHAQRHQTIHLFVSVARRRDHDLP